MRQNRFSLFLFFTLSCAVASCQQKKEASKAASDSETRAANAKGVWSEEQILKVTQDAEGPATQAVLSMVNKNFGAEKKLSPERRELVIEVLHRIAGTLEARKSLLPLEGERTWLEEDQIRKALMYLPDQKQFQVPNGAGGAVPLPLQWGMQILPKKLARVGALGQHPHADFMEVTEGWLEGIFKRLQSRENQGIYRNISLRELASGPAAASIGAATEAILAEHQQLFDTIDSLENTKYSFDLVDVFLADKKKNGSTKDTLHIYRKDALLQEILGGGRIKSEYGGQGTSEVSEKDKKVIENAPRTCATKINSIVHSTEAVDLEKQPRPYISLMAEKKRRNFAELGPFPEQQFCIGLVEHFVESLSL